MIRTGIVGCGKIADAHAAALSLVPDCEIVGVCDREELMAKQLYERFKIGKYYSDIRRMIEDSKPTVVHITTPPQSHYELGRICLEAGCHVYIEKPFTVNSAEAEDLVRLASEKDLKLTVGTDEQFSHVAMSMRKLVQEGYLGGNPVHMEAYYGYDLGDERYARAFLQDQTHWLRTLPGQLLHNIISHGIAKIVEFLQDRNVQVVAHGFTSPFLTGLGEKTLIDELRTIIIDQNRTTAYFTFSSQMRPLLREFRLYGPRNGLVLNQDHHSLVRLRGLAHKSYLEKFLPLRDMAKQYRRNMWNNAKLFIKKDFHMKAGLINLIRLFYDSIREGTPVPIPYEDILLTVRIMDSIFSQIRR